MRGGPDHVLCSALAPANIATLPYRSLAYVFQFEHFTPAFSDADGLSFVERLAAIAPDAPAAWHDLREASERCHRVWAPGNSAQPK